MSMLHLPRIEASGTPTELGEGIGQALRADVTAMIDRRMQAAEQYFSARGVGGTDRMIEVGAACLEMLADWDIDGWDEHNATASAAGVDTATLYAAANYSDVRDIVCIDLTAGDDEGCTSVAAPASMSTSGQLTVGQTWDLHPLDVDSVVAVHRLPNDQPETWSVTVAGAPTLIGMNQYGVWTGTTNIKVTGVRVGVCYMSLLHRAIRCHDRESAAAVIQHAPRAAAHTFLLADTEGAIELECAATTSTRRDLGKAALVRTNHCMSRSHVDAEAEPPSASSVSRAARAAHLMGRGDLNVEAIRALMKDRDGGVQAINRYPDDGEPTATNACVIGIPQARHMEACRGPADCGAWATLNFVCGS
jgi:hypothetical protein